MAIRNFVKAVWVAVLAAACTAEDPIETEAPIPSEPLVSSRPLSQVVVEFSDQMLSLIQKDPAALEGLGIESFERVFPDAGEFEERSRRAGLHRFYKVQMGADIPATKAAEGLSEVGGILSAEPSRPIHRRAFFNDTYLKDQWDLVNRNKEADIHVQEVWERYTTGNSRVIVSVVDDPVDPTHRDLLDNLWTDESGHTGRNFVRNSWDLTSTATDENGHGTHVAGTIAAVNNNGYLVSSIAGGNKAAGIPGVRIMSCAIYDGDEQCSDAESANAIKWAADHGAVISQNSWGYNADGCLGDEPDQVVSQEEYEVFTQVKIPAVLRRAIDYFIQNAGCDASGAQLPDSPMRGGLVLFAAGNEGDMGVDYDPICSYEPVIAVGSFGRSGNASYFSNYGDWVDIAAPGGDENNYIWSTYPEVHEDYHGIMGMIGTSMACPHASGVAALIISYFGGEGFTAETCKQILLGGAGPVVGGAKPVGRRLNALGSFEYALAGGGILLRLPQTSVTVKAHETLPLFLTVAGQGKVEVTCTPGSSALTYDAAAREVTIVGRDAAPGTYTASFHATDEEGNEADATLEYTLLPNHAPSLLKTPSNLVFKKLQENQTLSVGDIFLDVDGEELRCESAFSEPGIVNVSSAGEDLFVSAIGYGITQVELTAYDGLGEKVSARFMAAVVNPQKPVSLYPSLVSTDAYITIGAETEQAVQVEVHTATGALALRQHTTASIFSPVHLDVSALAPGRYTVDLSYSGESFRVRMLKY